MAEEGDFPLADSAPKEREGGNSDFGFLSAFGLRVSDFWPDRA
jgi:hypothetical protein